MINMALSAMEHRQTRLGRQAVIRALTEHESHESQWASIAQLINMSEQLGAQIERHKLCGHVWKQWKQIERVMEWAEREIDSGMYQEEEVREVRKDLRRVRIMTDWVRRDKLRMYSACTIKAHKAGAEKGE